MAVIFSCSTKIPPYQETEQEAKINPDYADITLPPNIAPLDFSINEAADKYLVKLISKENYSFILSSDNGKVIIPEGKWKKLLKCSKGKDINLEIYARKNNHWIKYKSITNHVSKDSIDNFLVYRLISPGFELWHKMGIYQRNLETYTEKPVFLSSLSDNSCMNCHSFCQNNPNMMMFHLRGKLGGTVIQRDKEISLFDTKTDQTISPAVYPFWHPSGRYIAYSVNQIIQSFHAVSDKKVEVMDTLSDVIVLDIDKRIILKSRRLSTKDNFETFPNWSPDGKFLYYCSAPAMPLDSFNRIRYSLMRIAFDPSSGTFGTIDTLVSCHKTGLSVSFPRISPDGKYLMFCMSNYGNFSIWHKESDLNLLNLSTGQISKPDINSSNTESYHQWSSTGRWIVFSSRRNNGLFTRLYFSHFDEQGNAQKPFLLPQKDPEFYESFMKSFNVPELITSSIKTDPRKLAEVARTTPLKTKVLNVD
jgi:hypothetical protein